MRAECCLEVSAQNAVTVVNLTQDGAKMDVDADDLDSGQQLTYREQLMEVVDNLDVLCKRLCQQSEGMTTFIKHSPIAAVQNRDPRLKSSSAPLTTLDRDGLADLVRSIHTEESTLQQRQTVADEFATRARRIDELQRESDAHTKTLLAVHETLQSAETIMSNCVFQVCARNNSLTHFQANEKLRSIRQAHSRPVAVDTLIHTAFCISRTNAVAAPATWRPGDPQRPYPTDAMMRRGWLGQQPQRPPQQQMTAEQQQMMNRPTPQSAVPSPYLMHQMMGASGSPQTQQPAPPTTRLPFPGAVGHQPSPMMMQPQQRLPFPSAQGWCKNRSQLVPLQVHRRSSPASSRSPRPA